MSPVTPTAPINPLPTVTADNHVSHEDRQQQLPVDKIVRATVAEGGQDKVMLELNHQRFQAETRLPLQTGQKLNLLVVATTPRIELQIIEDPLQQRLAQAMHILSEKWNLQPLSQFLTQEGQPIIDALSPLNREILLSWATMLNHDITALDGTGLRKLIINLGLGMEANLAQGKIEQMEEPLKSALLEIFNLDQPETELPDTAGRLLQLIELFQLWQIKLAQQDVLFLPLPLPFLDQGFIIADHLKQDEIEDNNKPPFKISLHLSLQKLGDLRIDLLHDSQGLHLRFVCASQEKADFVAAFKDQLMHDMQDVHPCDIAFAIGAESPATALIAKMIQHSDPILDTRA
jgi:hypothetical protein